jgi:hypothetical protein
MLINSPNISGSLKVTGNTVITGSLTVLGGINATITGSVTSASYVEYSNVANKPTLISGSEQVSFNGITDKPTLVSGSAQVSFNGITDKPTLVSGSSQITYSGISSIPSGIVSGSAQVASLGFATTGSNTFQANQTITGSLFITQNLVVAGSSSIQYISSSVLDIADNIITVNAFNPGVRFGGLAVIDSGSSPQVSGSLLFDSIKDQWIFVHQNQAVVTSSVLLMGPETYNDLGNESYISANRLPKGSGVEHLRDSNITDTGTIVSINSNTQVTGSFTVVSGSAVELQVTNTGVNIGSALIDSHIISGSLRVNPNGLFVSGSGVVGINTTSPQTPLQILRDTTGNGTSIEESNMAFTVLSAAGQSKISIGASNAGNYGYVQVMQDATSWTNRNLVLQPRGGNVGIGTYTPLDTFTDRTVLTINGTTNGAFLNFGSSGTLNAFIQSNTSGFQIGSQANIPVEIRVNGSNALVLAASGGAATFSSTVTLTTSSQPIINLNTTSANQASAIVTTESGTPKWAFGTNLGTGDNSFNIYNYAAATRYLTIASTGAATFSSSVTISDGNDLIFRNSSNYISSPSTDTLRIVTANTERMRITSGGNIGINKSNPDVNSILDVNGQTFVAHLAIYNNNGTPSLGTSPILYSPASGTLAISTNTAERMRINSSGNVGIGADPAYRLHVNFDGCGQYVSQITNQNSSDCGGSSVLILQGGTFNSSDTTSKYISFRRGDGNEIGSVRRNGTSNVVFETSSDYRLKTDLKDFNGLDKVSKIKVYDFKWIDDDQRMEGVMAHELQEVIPYAVGGIKDDIDEDGNILAQGVDYSKIVPALVKAIQEQQSQIEILKSKIEILEQS